MSIHFFKYIYIHKYTSLAKVILETVIIGTFFNICTVKNYFFTYLRTKKFQVKNYYLHILSHYLQANYHNKFPPQVWES